MKFYFGVTYIENGVLSSDSWSEETLLEEIRKGEVEIVGIMPSIPHNEKYRKEFMNFVHEMIE